MQGSGGHDHVPSRVEYTTLSLSKAVRHLAELHYEARTRHLSHDEYELLLRAADVLESIDPNRAAYP
jgi:hypothetical protein